MTFVPGTSRTKLSVFWRELQTFDVPQAARIVRAAGWKASERTVLRHVQYTGWAIRGAFRNKTTLIALYAGEFLSINDAALLRCFWVHPDYHATKVPQRLLQLARLELPEKPLNVLVPTKDDAMRALLLNLGLRDVSDDNPDGSEPTRRTYGIASVARREYRDALDAGRAVRETPERDDA
jgi:hypothetical protein